jgi:hypothetical protein
MKLAGVELADLVGWERIEGATAAIVLRPPTRDAVLFILTPQPRRGRARDAFVRLVRDHTAELPGFTIEPTVRHAATHTVLYGGARFPDARGQVRAFAILEGIFERTGVVFVCTASAFDFRVAELESLLFGRVASTALSWFDDFAS